MASHPFNLHRTRRPGAFTLIEILVVVVILIVIITMVVSIGSYIRTSAADKKTRSIEAILMTSVQAYYDKTHVYPNENQPTDASTITDPEAAALQRSKNLFTQLAALAEAKAKLAALPSEAITGSPGTQYFADAYNIPLDYRVSGGLGGVPVIISAGPDNRHGNNDKYEDDNIRSDR